MVYDLLIRNGTLLTMTDAAPVIENGAVVVKDGIIEKVGESEQLGSANARLTMDAASAVVLPGFVNCHTHLPMAMFRGLADALPLERWLNDHIFPAEAARVSPESVKKWALHSIQEMLLSGITTCCDGYFYEACVAEAALESGIRAVLGQGVIDFPAPGVPDPAENVRTARTFAETWKNIDSRIHPAIFCHAPYTCSGKTLQNAKAAARSLDILFQIHAAETGGEKGMIPDTSADSVIAYLNGLGLLDRQTLLVHCVWIDDADISTIGQSGCGVAHCPESNMKLASGIAPVRKLLENGVAVGIGTDGPASNNNHDMLAEMDTTAKLQKCFLEDPCAADARTVLWMATLGGAQALGLGDVTGSIAEGKKADLVVMDMEKPHLVPLYNPFSSIVYAAKSSDVRDVIVDGRILVRNRFFLR